MEKPFFVILKHPNGEYILPLVDERLELVQFASESEAIDGAKTSSLGDEIGYEVFDFRTPIL